MKWNVVSSGTIACEAARKEGGKVREIACTGEKRVQAKEFGT